MNGLKTLVLQDLTHVLPPKSLPIPSKLSTCNLHTAASARRFWNFFEFANKDEVPRDSEQCQVSKDIVPPEQIAGEMGEIGKIPQSAPAVTSMSMNPRMHGYQQLQDSPTNCWNASEPLKEDNLMSLLDGNSVPKTMKWKLKGYKTLRRHQTDEFAFVPGGIYDFDVDLLSDVQKVPKTNFGDVTASSARAVKNDIILSTKAIESKDFPRVTQRTEAVQLKNTETAKHSEKNQKLEDSTDLPVKTPESASGTKVPVAQKVLPLPKADQIKFLPISKPEVPTVSMKCQSQPTARYSSQPPDNSQKPPLHEPWLAKTTANKRHLDRQGTMEPVEESDTHSTAPQQSSAAPAKENWRTEAESRVHEESIEAAPAKQTMDEAYDQPDRLEAKMDAVDVYENRMADNRRDFAKATAARTSKNEDPADFAPGPWKHQRNENRQTRFQGKSDQKSLYSVYESMGISPKEGPPLKIVGPDLKQQGKTSPCAATQARLQQNGGNASQRQQGSFSYDGGSSMAGNGGGSRKPPAPYPPFTSRRSSSSNSSALRVPSKASIKGVPRSKVVSSNISTTSRRPGPRKCDDDDDGRMIEGKTICTKPRENKCSRKCEEPQKKSKPCKRYCCPALQTSSECDWSKSQCPKTKGGCGGNDRIRVEKRKTDPTCLPPEPENECGRNEERGREVCTTPRRSCGKRDRGCSQICNQHASPRQRCKRERRSCERRERSCDKQQRRQCDREQDRGGREICTKPRRRESCERRRDSCERRRDSCDRDRKATKCSGRRNYTQSAHTRRSDTRSNINRFFSMTTLGFSLVGVNHKESKNTLFRMPSPIRFYGKETSACDKPTACKTEQKKCKKPPAKCLDKKPSQPKCKIETKGKTESKCKIEYKNKPDIKSKPETKSKEKESKCSTKKNLCQTSCGKSAKKESPCKAGSSGADRCAQRRQQICKSAKASSEKETESTKERAERERKEMHECKKDISGRDKKKGQEGKKTATGLERVISPCKQQSGKGSTSSGKTSCAATTLNALSNPKSLFLNPDNDFAANSVSDRLFSTAKFSQYDHYDGQNPSDALQNHYMNIDDDVIADSGTITNIHQQEDTTNDSSTINNWFLSWFHS
ncbi:uncharacterized protein LOC143210466 [Lasioglossum baleicum]|uniref:uncharacterized protein LOC143210466 n=1 Tax=Lasioglossum baleicum TaxID=434251 RepID=UPI003FCCCF93